MEKQPSPPLLWLTRMLFLQSWWFLFATSTSWKPSNTLLNNITDQAALLTFKSQINLANNNDLSNSWNTNTSFCNWIGVTCSRRGQRVTELDLQGMALEGTIPPHIANLSFLVYLNLSHNNFHGQLPPEIGRLRRLEVIDLGANQMDGMIPPSLSCCEKLNYIRLDFNNLEGTIPPSLGNLSELDYVSLNNNGLYGEIPPAIFNISSLIVMILSYNMLSGSLPADTGRFLPNLEELRLYGNWISGAIPISLSNASKLTILNLGDNSLNGSIPDTLGNLLQLENLSLANNTLTGTIPFNIFNLSHIMYLDLGHNQFSGQLPPDIGNWLPSIKRFYLSDNVLNGKIPLSLGNASQLTLLDLSSNNFSGLIPYTLGKLSFLQILNLHTNQLMNEPGTNKLSIITHLTSCRLLEFLALAQNPMCGILPSSVRNFSILEEFYAYGCQIEGTIPIEFGNLSSLITLSLFDNNLHGTIPSTIGSVGKLQGLDLCGNILEGSIPIEFNRLRYLSLLFLRQNILSGGIPDIFQNLSGIQTISLENNKLSKIPSSLWTLQDLLYLNLCGNSLRGFIPEEVGNLKNAVEVDLSVNQFEGTITNSLGYLQMLQHLDLRSNSLEGPIPQSFSNLISIEYMDLSSNNLNGTIPKSLEILHYLQFLNISFNNLEGEIPNGGVFANITTQSFIGNYELCSTKNLHIKLNVSICSAHATKSRKKKKIVSPIENFPRVHESISYQELIYATSNFSESNLIGDGGFSSVYKGTMVDGSIIAVKVFNSQLEGALKFFYAEYEVMRQVRHRNLVKLITTCSNLDFRALILQFMPNGSLDQWLHSHNYLSLYQRIGIMIDVASAMEYLHHHYSCPIVHCDLKPSNVLIDEDMVAHVGDFGIAKLLDENKSTTQTETLGTIGYVAPEYGLEGKVSAKGDVYSYGILLLEMLTRKKPTDSMFTGSLSLRQWVNAAFPDEMMDVIDMNLLREIGSCENNGKEAGDPHERQLSLLLSIVEVGLFCSKEFPEERIGMKDVVVKLMKIKNEFCQ